MGKVFSIAIGYLKKPVRDFNVRERAHKYIEIPKVSPRHPSTIRIFEDHSRSFPHLKDELQRKDDRLLGHLKDVYVKSQSSDERAELTTPSADKINERPLPKHRQSMYRDDFDATTTRQGPAGKITLLDASKLLTEYDGEAMTSDKMEAVIEKYHLEPEVVNDILCYFSTLHLHNPKAASEKTLTEKAFALFARKGIFIDDKMEQSEEQPASSQAETNITNVEEGDSEINRKTQK